MRIIGNFSVLALSSVLLSSLVLSLMTTADAAWQIRGGVSSSSTASRTVTRTLEGDLYEQEETATATNNNESKTTTKEGDDGKDKNEKDMEKDDDKKDNKDNNYYYNTNYDSKNTSSKGEPSKGDTKYDTGSSKTFKKQWDKTLKYTKQSGRGFNGNGIGSDEIPSSKTMNEDDHSYSGQYVSWKEGVSTHTTTGGGSSKTSKKYHKANSTKKNGKKEYVNDVRDAHKLQKTE
jgi:hypothetical protein